MTVDNEAGAGDRVISIVDSFTPDVTNGVASPSAQTITRFYATVKQGSVDTFNKEDLEGVRCIGALTIDADVTDTGCHISVGYETD